ncbi:enoyl-CoA hydratase/isomerase family protein [Saccharopolyspora spinosa]|uniref:2-(1,2-epoxy-1,2-dihydrophenyl)acetyl-CoA isomerase n=1 Tax=Saccharopolyspora spinosa TaxID=60894 RepID=A0A2N3XXN3_SACSN|nr:enoyl-CoA hydratase-related protein [Saccharopolyspora spinosa]PKW15453.1 2-(1,2-epoxy-1,2-dihydrophenyl)acetyl-CoA isomerase [Saccharopolyspora spinosa]
MSASPVRIEWAGAVATVILDRPKQRNALDHATKGALRLALEAVGDAPSVRAVVLTGVGPAFCAGQDLGEHAAALEADAGAACDTVARDYNPIVQQIVSMPKPVIAAVCGACVGAGLGLALACDLRVFSEDASLGTAFSAIGLTCDTGLSATLVRSVGLARAKELVLLAKPFSAQDAVSWGIAATIVPDGEVDETAHRLAARLAAGPTAAYAASKLALEEVSTLTFDQALSAEARAQAALCLTQDHQDAVRSFLNKQKPVFTGH